MKENTKVESNELLDEEWSGEGVGNVDSDKEVKTADLDEILTEVDADNIEVKFEKIRKIKSAPEEKFKMKHSALELFITKSKLKWYIKQEEKHAIKSSKYRKLHNSLSLAVASGFSNVKTHQEHLKSLSRRTEKIGKSEA